MRPRIMAAASAVLLAAAAPLVMVGVAAQPAVHAPGATSSSWGDVAAREAYQQRLRRRPPSPPRGDVAAPFRPAAAAAAAGQADLRAFGNAVAKTREHVKCRDSDIILVSYPKARAPSAVALH